MQMDRVLAGRGREGGVSYRAMYGHRSGAEDVKVREIEALRSRLRELEDMVMVLDRPVENPLDMSQMFETRSAGNNQFDFSHSFNNVESPGLASLETTPVPGSYLGMTGSSPGVPGGGLESDSPETLERSLALLTAQYEKTSHEDERLDLSPGMLLDKSGDKSEPDMMPPAMVPLNNSESVRLARELRDKRDQLEQLMQKNVFTTNVNELSTPKPDMFSSSAVPGHRSKDTNRSHGVQVDGGGVGYPGYVPQRQLEPNPEFRVHPANQSHETNQSHPPTTHTDISWVSTQSQPHTTQSNSTSQQLYRLQDQVTKLKGELDRLSLPQQLPNSQPRSDQAATSQVAQLSASVNQLYAGLWAMQRDVSNLTERLLVLERTGEGRPESRETIPSPNTVDDNTELWQGQGNNTMNNNIWPGNTLAEPSDWPGLGSVQQQQNPFPLWEGHQHFSPFPSRDLWNSLQASPGFSNPLHPNLGMFGPNFHISETDSGVSSGALNNQVSPGMRANNYYDNFRSFSRQNRLDSLHNSPPNVHQNNQSINAQHGINLRQLSPDAAPANNAASSYIKTRKKHKINREQNMDSQAKNSTNLTRDAENAVQVMSRQNGRTSETMSGATPESCQNIAETNHSSVDNISKNIYSQIESLISSHEGSPEFLASLLEDLTVLGTNQNSSVLGTSQNSSAIRRNGRPSNDINSRNCCPAPHHS